MTPPLVLVVALWVLRGLAAAPSTLVAGALDRDLAAHSWVIWYANQAAEVANHPLGADFYPLERANLLIEGSLYTLVGATWAHNLACLLALVLAGVGGAALGRAVSPRPWAVPLGALLLETSPPVLEALNDGFFEFSWLGLPALALAALWRRSWWAIPAIALTGWACWYYALVLGLAGLSLAAMRRDWHPLAALAIGGVLLLPWAWHFSASDLEVETASSTIVDQPITRLRPWEPFGHLRPFWAMALLPALAGARKHAPWVVIALLGWVLSWGSELWGVPMPFRALNEALRLLARPMHLPAHMAVLPVLAAVALACAARLRWWTGLAVGAALLTPGSAVSELPDPSILHDLEGGALLELPSILEDDQQALDREALHQRVHGRPIPRFPIFPTSELRREGRDRVLADPWIQGLQSGQSGPFTLSGTSWVLVDEGSSLAPLVEASLGPPAREGDGLLLFQVRP